MSRKKPNDIEVKIKTPDGLFFRSKGKKKKVKNEIDDYFNFKL